MRSRRDSAPVVSMSVMGSPAMITWRTGSPRSATCFFTQREKCSALAKNTGASKRKMSTPGDLPGFGVAGHVVVAVAARDATEGRVVRPPHALQEREQREHDGDHDALQHADDRHAEERGEAEHELGAAHAPQPAHGGEVEERGARDDDDRRQRRLRQVRGQPAGEEQQAG